MSSDKEFLALVRKTHRQTFQKLTVKSMQQRVKEQLHALTEAQLLEARRLLSYTVSYEAFAVHLPVLYETYELLKKTPFIENAIAEMHTTSDDVHMHDDDD